MFGGLIACRDGGWCRCRGWRVGAGGRVGFSTSFDGLSRAVFCGSCLRAWRAMTSGMSGLPIPCPSNSRVMPFGDRGDRQAAAAAHFPGPGWSQLGDLFGRADPAGADAPGHDGVRPGPGGGLAVLAHRQHVALPVGKLREVGRVDGHVGGFACYVDAFGGYRVLSLAVSRAARRLPGPTTRCRRRGCG
jgi:hypothetical protein